jgi:hypothetical protein
MVATTTEPPWQVLLELFMKGKLIPFLGAGASAYCSSQPGGAPPSGAALLAKLAARSQLQIDCGISGCTQLRFDLARLASYYQTCIATRPRLDDLLKDEIANPDFAPNPLHYLLARISRRMPMLIITTNYDDLLERAFNDPKDGEGPVPYEVVVTPADELAYAQQSQDEAEPGPEHAGAVWHWVSGQEEDDFTPILGSQLTFDLSRRSIIYKIHGSVPRGNHWRGGYLIAEEDYARFLGQMEKRGIIPEAITSLIGRKTRISVGMRNKTVPVYSLLFLGYGMHDWNLRVLLEELQVGRRVAGEELHYAFMRNPDQMEKRLLEKRSVEVYDCDLTKMVSKTSELLQ